jgi:hypothetical protein
VRAKSISMKLPKLLFYFCIFYFQLSFSSLADFNIPIKLKLNNGVISIYPNGLVIDFQMHDHLEVIPIAIKEEKFLLAPINITQNDDVYKIEYKSGVKAELALIKDKLNIKIFPKEDGIISWPIIAENKFLKSYLIPEGEGLYVPVNDRKIRSILANQILSHGQVLPFLGYLYDNLSITLIIHNPYRTNIALNDYQHGQIVSYDFRTRDLQPSFEVSFAFSQPDILQPSKIFKQFLKEQNQYISLKKKIETNTDVNKLAGALHIYVWGDGRTTDALETLSNLGITKAWIGYEEKPNNPLKNQWSATQYVDNKYIEKAKQLGYLIGAYDSYHTMQPSAKADSYNTDFGDNFYSRGCVRDREGKVVKGFKGRGCAVSMTALNSNSFLIQRRLDKFKHDGINSYFLDCHGMLEGYDDYSHDHQQTVLTDISVRLKHLKYLSSQNIVLGSEAATTYTIPFLSYSHGNFSTLYNLHYPLMSNKKIYGGWAPAKRPQIFFKSVIADTNYTIRYSPEYRLPILQAVFHESIVTTDRWDIPLTKFTNLYIDRFLLEFLYGVPSIWNLDLEAIEQYKNILKQLANEFTPIHSKIMTMELTGFEYLSNDRLLQKVVYDLGKVIMIGNFRNISYEDIPAKSIKIISNDTNEIKVITPENL